MSPTSPEDVAKLCERLRDRLLTLPFHHIKGGESWGVELVEVDRMIREVCGTETGAKSEGRRVEPGVRR